jgi:NAD(P)-dependent dehydrogenase (short-subunit alcohol dehydrogenase family)
MKLTGKAALITGGGRGIGRAIVLACAGAGADVAVLGRARSEIDAVAAEIAAMGRLGVAEVCDVTDCTAVDRAVVSAVEKLGRLDILVNNAGGGTERTYIGDDDPENWVRVIELNLHGTYFCTRAALPYLKAARGANIIILDRAWGINLARGTALTTPQKPACGC